MQNPIVIHYDSEARILWLSDSHPAYRGGIGSYPWEWVAEAEAVRDAALTCLNQRVETSVEATWGEAGRWRVWFMPVEIPNARVRMTALAMPVPRGIQLLGERELSICQLIAQGFTEEAAAEILGISIRSVRKAKHDAASTIGVPTHDLPVWCGENRRFLEPL